MKRIKNKWTHFKLPNIIVDHKNVTKLLKKASNWAWLRFSGLAVNERHFLVSMRLHKIGWTPCPLHLDVCDNHRYSLGPVTLKLMRGKVPVTEPRHILDINRHFEIRLGTYYILSDLICKECVGNRRPDYATLHCLNKIPEFVILKPWNRR